MLANVDEWEKSGQTLREFAKTKGLSKRVFEYWVRKKKESSSISPGFVELAPLARHKVNIEAKSQHPDCGNNNSRAQIVITFPSGMCVKVYG